MNSLFVWDIDPVIFSLGSAQLRYYSIFFVLGLFLGVKVLEYCFKKENLSYELLGSLILYLAVGIFAGARLGHCLFYEPAYFLSHPLEMIFPIARNSEGVYRFVGYHGLASHGGAIGVLLATALFAWRKKLNFLSLMDKMAVAAPLIGCCIRIGNFFNSEIIGKASSGLFAVVFAKVDLIPRHPSQLYEAVCYLLFFIIMITLYRKKRTSFAPGFLFGLGIFLIFSARFALEYTKVIQVAFERGMALNMGQWLSLPFIIAGIVTMCFTSKPQCNTSLPPTPSV